jgi:hypothetical protein
MGLPRSAGNASSPKAEWVREAYRLISLPITRPTPNATSRLMTGRSSICCFTAATPLRPRRLGRLVGFLRRGRRSSPSSSALLGAARRAPAVQDARNGFERMAEEIRRSHAGLETARERRRAAVQQIARVADAD